MEKLFQALLRFFGAVASALTGLGAICTAAGFLAERTRWSMLGLGTVSVDLNEYLFTGSRFLAFLPGILLTTTLSVLTGSGRVFLLAIALVVLALVSRSLLRRPAGARMRSAALSWAAPRRAALLSAGLVGLAILQFAATLFLFRAAGIRNLLFTAGAPGASCVEPSLPLEALIRRGCEARLDQAMGEAFLVVLASGVLVWMLLRARGSEPTRGTLGGTALVAVNVSLLAVQLVLLPINYGALFLRNEFPVVQVARAGDDGRPEDRAGVAEASRDDGRAAGPPAAEAPADAAGATGPPAAEAPADAAGATDPTAAEAPADGPLASGARGADPSLADRQALSGVATGWPRDGRFYLLQRRGDEFYLYSTAARRVWLVPRSGLTSVVYLGICRLFLPEGAETTGACAFDEGIGDG
jgi:hypothetical protein